MTPRHTWTHALLQLLAPQRCPGCDLALDAADAMMCGACEPLLEFAAGRRPPQAQAAAFLFAGPLADALRRFKYAARAEFSRPLGQRLAREAMAFAGQVDVVMPIPLHAARLRERGFNQSALLAGHVARGLAVPLDTRSLQRIRATLDQAGLGRAERARNVRGAFVSRPASPKAARVLLIDDVETTGATLDAAASALRAAGHASVRTLAMAYAEPPP